MFNVSGWRSEPGQVVSDVTARLLRWMERAHLGAALSVDEVADEIHLGLCELMDASSAVVLSRPAADDVLLLMAASQSDFGSLLTDFDIPRFPSRALMSVLPIEPFFIEQASPHVRVLIGELWDSMRDSASLARTMNSAAPPTDESAGTASVFVTAEELAESTHAGGDLGAPALAVPLRNLSVAGYGETTGLALLWMSSEDGMASITLQPALESASRQAGGWMAGALRADRLGESYRKLGAVFANAIDTKDPQRSGHSEAVSYYAATIARGLGLAEHEVERVEFAGLLHDIGKIAVPDSILKKNSQLSIDEMEMIRQATVNSAEWLREVDGLQEVAMMVRHQGERFDGGGFPDGLSGEGIPLGARILAVALRFSAMTKPRANRRAMSVVGGALESLAQDSGASLDPRVVNAFMLTMGRTF